jgi:hypothetical protein
MRPGILGRVQYDCKPIGTVAVPRACSVHSVCMSGVLRGSKREPVVTARATAAVAYHT